MDPLDVIDAFYDACFAGDIERALSHCSVDAQWHAVTPGPGFAGSYPIRQYVSEILPRSITEMENFNIESVERDVIDELVVSRVRTSHGSGVMVFRVAADQLTDIWGVNSKGRESVGWF